MTAAELKDEARSRGLAVGGNKAKLIERLAEYDASSTISAEIGGGEENEGLLSRIQQRAPWATIPAIAVVAILVVATGTTAFIFAEDFIDWVSGGIVYELIEFDRDEARGFAEGLVALGHPEWDGRMSGSIEERNTAESNKANFTSFGMSTTMDSFAVSMFEITSAPTLSICSPGNLNAVAPCSDPDMIFGASIEEFQHRIDFVIQGYSGSNDIRYSDRMPVTDLGNGSDVSAWENASGTVGLVWGQAGVASNTELFLQAQTNDLFALILVAVAKDPDNPPGNCKIPGENRCVPYFKSVDISQFETVPEGVPFMMVSDEVGEKIRDRVVSGSDLIQIYTDVDNQGQREVYVPCGVIPGQTAQLIIFGAHHDTVYSGPGAIDDTSGSATVLELARQFALMTESRGEPYYTLKFCTWGGEEEGLHGSKAYVNMYRDELREYLRLYVNLDMHHVDIDHATRGNDIYLFGNDARDTDEIRDIVSLFNEKNPSGLASTYDIHISTKDGEKNSPTGMPYNSDHGPFVYDIQEAEGGDPGRALVCYGTGSWEYHTYKDDMSHFNAESLAVSGIIYGTYAAGLSWG